MAFDVFISYSSKDKAAADAACATLESSGVRAWIAPRDVRPGVEYGAAIVDAIEQCRALVLIFSSSANNSGQILREVERAVSKGIPIVPVRIEGVLPTKSMEYFLGTIHWLDALTPPLENHLRKLVDIVNAILTSDAGDVDGSSRKKPSFHALSYAETQPPTSSASGARRIGLFGLLGVAVAAVLGGAAWLYLPSQSLVSEPPARQVELLVPETVPFVTDRDRAAIRSDYMSAPDHKALAISARIAFATGQASEEAAKSSALATCERSAGSETKKCELYAVGTTLVMIGRPPMPPAPWVVRNPAVERPFAPNQAPLSPAANYRAAMERYAAGLKPKAVAVSQRGFASFHGQTSQDEAIRRALEFCGSQSSIACLVVAVDDVFVVAIPNSMKSVGLFHPATEPSIAPGARGTVAGRLANAASGWNAVAVGAGGRPGLGLRAADEREAVNGALSDCGRQDHSCRIIAIGPFLVEPLASRPN